MEDVLSIYKLPYEETRPVVCLDELPYQMLGETVEPLEMKSGQIKRLDYEYKREGTASVFVAFEPLTGKRIVEVRKRRTKTDYCDFAEKLAAHFREPRKSS